MRCQMSSAMAAAEGHVPILQSELEETQEPENVPSNSLQPAQTRMAVVEQR